MEENKRRNSQWALTSAVMLVALVGVMQVTVVESASRQEQDLLLLDALSRKYPQNSNNQFEQNSVMDMLGRSTDSCLYFGRVATIEL